MAEVTLRVVQHSSHDTATKRWQHSDGILLVTIHAAWVVSNDSIILRETDPRQPQRVVAAP